MKNWQRKRRTSMGVFSLRFSTILCLGAVVIGCSPEGEKDISVSSKSDLSSQEVLEIPSDGTDDANSSSVDVRVSSPKFEFRPNRRPEDTDDSSDRNRAEDRLPSSNASQVRFSEVQQELGVEHVYENGAAGQAMISETIGGGCGWLDFDRDGRPDLFLNQAGSAVEALQFAEFAARGVPTNELSEDDKSAVGTQSGGANSLPLDALWRNEVYGGEAGSFDSVTRPARIAEPNYSQGVAIADIDNDGFEDIYVTNLGENTLWLNCGDGTFRESAKLSGVADAKWGVSAGWHDWDRDGDLDLYVCNYCDYDPRNPFECLDRQGRPTICNPSVLPPQPDVAYVNNGDGTFTEQSNALGLFGDGNRALGVALADFTNDGWPDIYVANDTTDNFLFVNDGTGHFVDEATLRGCAVDRAGGPQGSMGLAVADVDGNGFLDIYSTHYFEESNTLYLNQGDAGFRDETAIAGLHQPTLAFLGFGTAFADLNHDGAYELLVCNGHVDHSQRAADPKMQPQIFSMTSPRRWADVSSNAGSFFQNRYMARGLAKADYDLDGDLDFAVCNENDPAVLLRNDSEKFGDHWLEIELVGTQSNRSAIGSRIELEHSKSSAGDRSKLVVRIAELVGGSSFASTHQGVIHFGLGDVAEDTVKVDIDWPSRMRQTLELPVNQRHLVVEPASQD